MKIADGTVVAIDYTLTDDTGEVIDASEGEPLEYLHGQGQLVPGLERQLAGKQAGDACQIKVLAKEGYGEHDAALVHEVERAEFPEDLDPEVGMELSTEGPDGEPVRLWVVNVTDKAITLDGNHPLAGQNLNFAIDVRQVRAATAEEISHGHAHGPNHDH